MSLVFSLIAALIATLVQQWVREYMHVFQRYGNPLKSTRLRQYLYEGVERWHMPRVARSVLRYCRNVRPTWVKFNSKDTKESEWVFEVLSTKFKKRT